MQIYPNIADNSVKVKMQINNCTRKSFDGTLSFHITGTDYDQATDVPVSGNDTVEVIEQTIRLGKKITLWDEFQPNLYKMECKLKTTAAGQNFEFAKEATFGMREVTASKDHICVEQWKTPYSPKRVTLPSTTHPGNVF